MLWTVKITQVGLQGRRFFYSHNWKFRGRAGFGVDSVASFELHVLVILLSLHLPTYWFCP